MGRRRVSPGSRGDAQRAVLPIENSTAGSVHEVYDLLFQLNLSIVGEEVLEVRHCLLATPGATLEGVTRVLSHPQALAQCGEFLAERPSIAVSSKVRLAAQSRPTQVIAVAAAAIAGSSSRP